jgi:hypothetical protein
MWLGPFVIVVVELRLVIAVAVVSFEILFVWVSE